MPQLPPNPGDMQPVVSTALTPEVVTDRERREALESHPTNELGRAFTGAFERFANHVDAGGRFENLTLHAVHPQLGIGLRLDLLRPAGGEIDEDFGAADSALIPVVSIDISVPKERHGERSAQSQIASVVVGGEIEFTVNDDAEEGGIVAASSAIGTESNQIVSSGAVDDAPEVPVIHVDLGVMSNLEEAPEFGLGAHVEEFAKENPDLMGRYGEAMNAFRENHNQKLLGQIQEADEAFVDWQMERERLLVVDASVSRMASTRPEDDQAVLDARSVLNDMVERVGDPEFSDSLRPEHYLATSHENLVARDIWLGNEVAHREIAGPLERVLVDILMNGDLRPLTPSALGSQASLPDGQ